MKHPFYPEVPMMTIAATSNELIAIGTVISHYLNRIEYLPNKTKDQLEMIALLHSFQGRVVALTQNQPMTTPGSREVPR